MTDEKTIVSNMKLVFDELFKYEKSIYDPKHLDQQ